jgi:hypothetical protein
MLAVAMKLLVLLGLLSSLASAAPLRGNVLVPTGVKLHATAAAARDDASPPSDPRALLDDVAILLVARDDNRNLNGETRTERTGANRAGGATVAGQRQPFGCR